MASLQSVQYRQIEARGGIVQKSDEETIRVGRIITIRVMAARIPALNGRPFNSEVNGSLS